MNISDEAVEILARREYELIADHDDEFPSWDDVVRDPAWAATVRDCRDDARKILEAAAPHLMAAALEDAADAAANFDLESVTQNSLRARAESYRAAGVVE